MSKPIRVLHVLAVMDMAGTETLLMNFYRNIDRDKVQFDFAVSSEKEGAYDSEILKLNGRIYHYPLYRGRNHFYYIKWWNEFFDKHKEYHIIHGHIGSTAAIYLSIAKKRGIYAIAHSHSTNSKMNVHSVLYRLYSYPTRFIADYFFGCSEQALIDRYGKAIANNRKKARVLNNAIDAQKYTFNENKRIEIRDEYKIGDNELILGTVGRLTLQKNPYAIIEICSELKRRGLKYRFMWFGAGELKEKIKTQLKEKDLFEIINLYGTRADIYNILQAMDIFLFPSLWEGLGIACIEAQAAGLPTLCSDAVPIEAKATDLCEFIELGNISHWCDIIEKKAKLVTDISYKRKNTVTEIINSGYDIKMLAKWLENFYLEVKGTKNGLIQDCQKSKN